MIDDERADAEIAVPLDAGDVCKVRAFVDEIKRTKPNTRRARLSAEERDVMELTSKLGEVAFGRCFGCGVDWTVHAGGDHGVDFRMWTGDTVDVKAIAVARNLAHDFELPLAGADLVSGAAYFVQVLIAPRNEYALITGAITRSRFVAQAVAEHGWAHRGAVCPRVVKRSQLSRAFPVAWFLEPRG